MSNKLCYFCEEEIEFREATPETKALLFNKGANLKPCWFHVRSGLVSCETVATPSNIELLHKTN